MNYINHFNEDWFIIFDKQIDKYNNGKIGKSNKIIIISKIISTISKITKLSTI